jgi:hypothetical protein
MALDYWRFDQYKAPWSLAAFSTIDRCAQPEEHPEELR